MHSRQVNVLAGVLLLAGGCGDDPVAGTLLGGDEEVPAGDGDSGAGLPESTLHDGGSPDGPLDAGMASHDAMADGAVDDPTGDGDGADGDAGVVQPGPWTACKYDPDQVYAIGHIGPNKTGPVAVTSLGAEPRVCGFLKAIPHTASITQQGELVYEQITSTVRTFGPDEPASLPAGDPLATVEDNDPERWYACPEGSVLSGVLAPPDDGRLIVHCYYSGTTHWDAMWTDGEFASHAAPEDMTVQGIGASGMLLVQSVEDPYWVYVAHAPASLGVVSGAMPDFVAAAHSTKLGIHVASSGNVLWLVKDDKTSTEIGDFAAPPAESQYTTFYPEVLDGAGDGYQIVPLDGGARGVIRASVDGTSEVVYREPESGTLTRPDAASVFLEDALLVTGS